MGPWVRWVAIAAAAAMIVVLFVALQPDAAEDGPSPTPSPSPSVTPSATSSPSPEPLAPEATLIEITVRNGDVQGPGRPKATQGDDVRIVVRADVSDHVHLHGYDLMADVSPGRPARIDFVADAAGVFEVELEDAGRLLFHLEIVP